jgi:hypothetical protein
MTAPAAWLLLAMTLPTGMPDSLCRESAVRETGLDSMFVVGARANHADTTLGALWIRGWSGTAYVSVRVPPGEWNISVRLQDMAGNRQTCVGPSVPFSWAADAPPPESGKPEWFDIAGRRITQKPASGFYIERVGRRVRKVPTIR